MNSNKTNFTDCMKELYLKIPVTSWICFCTGIIVGMITHLFMLMNKLPNWDEINNFGGTGSGDTWGRWFLKYVRPLSGTWSVPAINGTLTIAIIAVASCFILETLELKSVTSAVLLPIMAVTFPGLTSIMTFMFTANSYATGILMVSIGAYLLTKYKYGFIPATILFVCSLGIYQSYICLAAGILVLRLLLDLLGEKKTTDVIKKGVVSMITLGVSLISYAAITKSLTTLTNDQGISKMGQVELTRIPRLILRCYKRIAEFFIFDPYSYVSDTMHFVNVLTVILIAVVSILVFVQSKLYVDKIRGFMIVLAILFFPLALASIYLLAPDTQDAAMTMLYQYFMVYVFLLALTEKIKLPVLQENTSNVIWRKVVIGLSITASVVIIWMGYLNFLITNDAYFRMNLAYEHVSAYYNRIVMRIEEQPGFEYGDPILILGNAYPDRYPVASIDMNDDRFTELSGVATENGMLTEGVRLEFLKVYLGLNIPYIEWEVLEQMEETEEYKELPTYPSEGCVKKMNDIWVVKIYQSAE